MLSLSHPSPVTPWLTRLVTLLLATLAAASLGYWTLRWPAPALPYRAPALVAATTPLDSSKVARLLGAGLSGANLLKTSTDIRATTDFKLLGVIATGRQSGSALIAGNGLPAKPYRVGDHVSNNLVLQSVSARSVTLGNPGTSDSLSLELPRLNQDQ